MEKTLADNPPLSRSILSTADPEEIRRKLDIFCNTYLDSELEQVFLFHLSIGASFGLLLRNGRCIFLKTHPPERPSEYLEAVHLVQAHLHLRNFPCPEPLIGPRPFAIGLATVDEFVDRGQIPDGHDPKVRREVAKELVRQIDPPEKYQTSGASKKAGPGPARTRCGPRAPQCPLRLRGHY